jgi:phosphopantothenoylcysteine decarboxylase/phosphopantothenate--cysteine ligase
VKIVLGISGSIAAYKALDLTRLLIKNGHEVKIVLTPAAQNFITLLSCQTLSNTEVYMEQFVPARGIKHLTLAEWGDLLVVAPATADIIGKTAAGIADDLLSTALVSFSKPILFVPAMDQGMWDNPRVRANVRSLRADGYQFMEPISGSLASGKIGKGRFPPGELIYRKILTVVQRKGSLVGRRFLVTGGRTEADMDPVRIISNRSSGRMALELLTAALNRGAEVRGIFGEIGMSLPEGLPVTRVRTSREMLRALKTEIGWCDCLIMAAAVNDYEPSAVSCAKRHAGKFNMTLKKAPDLLQSLAALKGDRLFVGFSLEPGDGADRAREKMKDKNLDLIVFNTPQSLGGDRSDARILSRDGRSKGYGMIDKWTMANHVLDACRVRAAIQRRSPKKTRIR